MTVELKPCPICGEVLDIGSEAMMGYSLHCKCGLTFGYFKKSDDLIAAWNRRAPEPGALEVIQKLIEELEDIQNRGSYLSLSSCLHILKEAERLLRENRREGTTSVIRWTRYDGTPETLPEGPALAIRKEIGESHGYEVFYDAVGAPCWKRGMTFWYMEIGDLWAYLPAPPEEVE